MFISRYLVSKASFFRWQESVESVQCSVLRCSLRAPHPESLREYLGKCGKNVRAETRRYAVGCCLLDVTWLLPSWSCLWPTHVTCFISDINIQMSCSKSLYLWLSEDNPNMEWLDHLQAIPLSGEVSW